MAINLQSFALAAKVPSSGMLEGATELKSEISRYGHWYGKRPGCNGARVKCSIRVASNGARVLLGECRLKHTFVFVLP